MQNQLNTLKRRNLNSDKINGNIRSAKETQQGTLELQDGIFRIIRPLVKLKNR